MSHAPHVTLSTPDLRAMRDGVHAVTVPSAIFRVEGRAALQCVQGVYTNDVVSRPGDALVWGGVLTAKGMIVFDMWVMRDGDAAWMIVPASAHDTAATLFARTFPPRIAKVTDVTADHRAHWIIGAHAPADVRFVKPSGPAPFVALRLAPNQSEHGFPGDLPEGPAHWADAARLLHGWPTLGREIDDRTLPQEVRFDALDGVRYDKGCYTGQETVARLHFRGHPNRMLRGLLWQDELTPAGQDIVLDEKSVGKISTWGRIGARTLGLAKVRREVETGAEVVAGGIIARVVDLPFDEA